MKISRRSLLAGAAAGALGLGLDKADAALCYCQGWGVLPIGGGGFMDGISQSTDGVTTISRNDSGHAYIWSVSNNRWVNITTQASIPAPYNVIGAMTYECVVAPSNNQVIYLLFDGQMFKSTNAGASFSLLSSFAGGSGVNPNTVGSNDPVPRINGYKIAVDPINANVCVVGTGADGLWITRDGGTTWTLTPVPPAIPTAVTKSVTVTGVVGNVISFASTSGQGNNQYVFDVTNPAALAAQTTVSSFTSTSITVNNSPAGVTNGDVIHLVDVTTVNVGYSNYCVAFDPSSSVSGGKTQGIYAYGTGSQVYHSTDGGTTWSALGSGPTTTAQCLRVAPNGTVWVISDNADFSSPNSNVWSWNGSFTQYASANFQGAAHTLALKPNSSDYVIVFGTSTNPISLTTTATSTVTWTGGFVGVTTPTYHDNPNAATAVPWLKNINNGTPVPSAGCCTFDNNTTKLWMASGVGTYYVDPAPTSRVTFSWFENTYGVENLVVQDILSPPGSSIVTVAVQDRQLFSLTPGTYPTTFTPTTVGINAAGALCYAAFASSYMAAVIKGNQANWCYSTDGGNTWTIFTNVPAILGSLGGSIAASTFTNTTTANVVAVGGGATTVYYTTSNGNSAWNVCGNLPVANGWTSSSGARILAADYGISGVFYIYFSNAGGNQGFWRSMDGGATWTQVYNGNPSSAGGTTRLRALPGVGGTILFNNSTIFETGTLQICTNALTSTGLGSPLVWNNINTNLTGVLDFGFGAYAPGATYPTIFVVGTYQGVQGFWKSTNLGSTWTQLQPSGTNPLGHVAQWSCVGTNMNYYDRMFVGTANDGCYWFS